MVPSRSKVVASRQQGVRVPHRFGTMVGAPPGGQTISGITDSGQVGEPSQTRAGASSLHMRVSKYAERSCGCGLDSVHNTPSSAFVFDGKKSGFTSARSPWSMYR